LIAEPGRGTGVGGREAPIVEIRLLGNAELHEVTGAGRKPVSVPAKLMALLAYLAVEPTTGTHRRESLLGVFWPDSDPDRARASLRTSLSRLRETLGPGVLRTRGNDEVELDRGRVWCDVRGFTAACARADHAEGLALYRGPFLQDFTLSGVPTVAWWIESQRTRLQAAACEAAWRLAVAAREAGDPREAARRARQSIHLAPLHEPCARRAIELLRELGDWAGALRAHQRFERRLRTELGTGASPATRRLAESLRRPPARRDSRTDPGASA